VINRTIPRAGVRGHNQYNQMVDQKETWYTCTGGSEEKKVKGETRRDEQDGENKRTEQHRKVEAQKTWQQDPV